MTKKVTLQDIANYCGLSKSMVAQVVRDPENCKAKQRTKDIIAEAVKVLGYRPNLAAKSLSTNQTYTIGVLMPNINGFYYELSIQLEKILSKHGYYCLFSYWEAGENEKELFKKAVARIIEHGIDGIITSQYDETMVELGVPVVTYGNERRIMDCVYPDKLDCLKRTVEYLVKHGHRDIGYMGYPGDVREVEISNTLQEHGIALNSDWLVLGRVQQKDGYEGMKKMLEKSRPSAVITHSDLMAVGALKYTSEIGIRIPEDMSLISYDNLPLAEYTIPALTTFNQCYETGAKLLVDAVLNRIKKSDIPQQKFSFKLPLVERDSVGKYSEERKQEG